MAKVILIGQPANESERQTIGFLRNHLPDGWLIFHNFEVRQGEEVFKIGIAILAPHVIYLVDVKGTRGNIDVYGSKRYPERRQKFHSPLAKLRSHAKVMSTLLADSNKGIVELRKVHVHAVVLLTANDTQLYDPAGVDSPDVTDYKRYLKLFTDKDKTPSYCLSDIRSYHLHIGKVIQGRTEPKSAPPVFGN